MIKMLRIKSVSLYDRVVIEGNEIEMLWDVRGCHKIKIADVGVVKGNINRIRFIVTDITKPIKISFYGIAKRKTETINFIGSKINLLNKFYTESSLPIAVEVPYKNEILESEFSNKDLKINFEKIFFEFETFDQTKYEPQTTKMK